MIHLLSGAANSVSGVVKGLLDNLDLYTSIYNAECDCRNGDEEDGLSKAGRQKAFAREGLIDRDSNAGTTRNQTRIGKVGKTATHLR